MNAKKLVKKRLEKAGIKINGNNPQDIRVYHDGFYDDIITRHSLGLGESYMRKWWDVDKLDDFIFCLLKSGVKDRSRVKKIIASAFSLRALFTNTGSKKRSSEIGEKHYDIGNDLYSLMLGKSMVYSCGFWKDAKDLNEAQEHKMELICKKLQLKSGMRVLDIGCGFGSLAKYMAQNYGVEVLGITVSEEQSRFAKETCAGLSSVDIRLMDYRDVVAKLDILGTFDKIVSVGMFEHVGWKNYRTYMKEVYKLLRDDGIFLLHTIGCDRDRITTDPWINKHIFPGSIIPSEKRIISSARNLFVMQDWHNFGLDYDKTLMAWFDNFDKNWGKISKEYGDLFYRMWKFYLLSCAAAFRAEHVYLWQIVFTKKGEEIAYHSVR